MGTFAPAYPPALMTREAAAHYLGCSEVYLDRLRTAGHVTAVSFGEKDRRVLYRRSDLDELVSTLPEKHPTRD